MNKKGNALNILSGLAIGVATIAIVLTVTFLIMSEGKTQIADIESLDTDGDGTINATESMKSIAMNATGTLQSAVDTIPAWIPLVIITVVGVALLGLVRMFRT